MTTVTRSKAFRREMRYFHKTLTCSPVDQNQTSASTLTWSDVRTGVENPYWRDQVSQGIQAGTAMTASGISVQSVPDYGYISYRMNSGTCKGQIRKSWFYGTSHIAPSSSDFFAPALPSSTIRNRALARFYDKARKAQRQFQSGVAFGELRETVRMLRNPLRTLRDGVDFYDWTLRRRLKARKKPPQIRQIATDTWLEFQFGWRPLWNDVIEATKLILTSRVLEEYLRISAIEFSDVATTQAGPSGDGGSGQYFAIRSNRVSIDRSSVRYIGTVRSRPVNVRSPLVGRMGLSPGDFLPTLYELMPWSFLIDYFTNLGDFVSSLSFHRANFGWVVETQRTLRTIKYSAVPNRAFIEQQLEPAASLLATSFVPQPLVITSRVVQRTPLFDVPIPDLHFELPSMLQSLNIAALIASRDRWRGFR